MTETKIHIKMQERYKISIKTMIWKKKKKIRINVERNKDLWRYETKVEIKIKWITKTNLNPWVKTIDENKIQRKIKSKNENELPKQIKDENGVWI